jgi:CBS domain containing-hemolysin-like protein
MLCAAKGSALGRGPAEGSGPVRRQVVVPPDARMDDVLGKLEDGEAGRVLVAQDGEVVGIITPSDLTRWLRRWRTLDTSAR